MNTFSINIKSLSLPKRATFSPPFMNMRGNIYLACAFVILCVVVIVVSAQNTDSAYLKKAEVYQNQQRAAALSSLAFDIKQVDDAPQRCFLRTEIASALFEGKIESYHDKADSLLLDCLEDTIDNPDHFSDMQMNWAKGEVLGLLRKYSPKLAAKSEKKYFAKAGDTDLTDEFEALAGTNPAETARKLVAKINRGEISPGISMIIEEIKGRDWVAAMAILNAVLNYYRANPEKVHTDMRLPFLIYSYLDSRLPIETKNGFYALLLRMGEMAIADPDNSPLWASARSSLATALPDIQKVNPELYPRASALYNALKSAQSEYERERDEVWKRINESKDKLAQALSEAESARHKNLKNDLLVAASGYAIEEKKFRLAADTRLKVSLEKLIRISGSGSKESPDMAEATKVSHSYFLTDQLLEDCLKENDIESAEYAVSLAEVPWMKGKGLFKIADKLVTLGKKEQAFDRLNDGQKMMEKAELKREKIWVISSVGLRAALKIDKTRAFDIASDLVKTINRIPTPGPDDKPGTDARKDYTYTLTAVSHNLRDAFRLLGKENMALADSISQGVQLREWRLAVRIALETERLYPLPPELNAKPPLKTAQ